MKTVALALAAAVLIATPATLAFAQGDQASTPASAKPKTWAVGDRAPSAYTNRRFRVTDPAALKLKPAGADHEWLLVAGKAYRVDTRTNVIKEIAEVAPELASNTPR